MSESNQKNRWWDIAVLASAVTILGIGYAVGQGHANGLISYLKEVNLQQKSEIDKLNSLLTKLEREVAFKPFLLENNVELVTPKKDNLHEELNINNEAKTKHTEFYKETSISSENSVRLYNGELVISVSGMRFQGSPLRYAVYGSIGGVRT